MRKDPYEKEGYVYIFDYNLGLPIYYTLEEYAIIEREEETANKQSRLHILEGYLAAIENIDEVLTIIRTSKNRTDAKNKLMQTIGITKKQASAILQMKLKTITQMSYEEIEKEHQSLSSELSSN